MAATLLWAEIPEDKSHPLLLLLSMSFEKRTIGSKHGSPSGISCEHVSHCTVDAFLPLSSVDRLWALWRAPPHPSLGIIRWAHGSTFPCAGCESKCTEAALLGAGSWVLQKPLHPFAQLGHAAGSHWAFRQLKYSASFSDNRARSLLCCPCVIHSLILRAGLYFPLPSTAWVKGSPAVAPMRSTFRG